MQGCDFDRSWFKWGVYRVVKNRDRHRDLLSCKVRVDVVVVTFLVVASRCLLKVDSQSYNFPTRFVYHYNKLIRG